MPAPTPATVQLVPSAPAQGPVTEALNAKLRIAAL
jgi:hypothetical protein